MSPKEAAVFMRKHENSDDDDLRSLIEDLEALRHEDDSED
jgi:hypothetical protein